MVRSDPVCAWFSAELEAFNCPSKPVNGASVPATGNGFPSGPAPPSLT